MFENILSDNIFEFKALSFLNNHILHYILFSMYKKIKWRKGTIKILLSGIRTWIDYIYWIFFGEYKTKSPTPKM